MKLYIHGISSVCAVPGEPGAASFYAPDPDYSKYIPAAQQRRMSRIVKTGLTIAREALESAGSPRIDAIVVGTGFGCFEDSEKFLVSLISNGESLLSPTPFIQSTHNTVGAQIALSLACHGVNSTHSNGGNSFEAALLESNILLAEFPEYNLLLGSSDELTQSHVNLFQHAGISHSANNPNEIIPGEGTAFFVLNANESGAMASFLDVRTFYQPGYDDYADQINTTLNKHGFTATDIGTLYLGTCGKGTHNNLLNRIKNELFAEIETILYKTTAGEFHSVTGLAAAMAADQIQKRGSDRPVLILNQFFGREHSMILMR